MHLLRIIVSLLILNCHFFKDVVSKLLTVENAQLSAFQCIVS